MTFNAGQMNDPVFDEQMYALQAETDPIKRQAMVKAAGVYLIEHVRHLGLPVGNYDNWCGRG